MMFGKILLLPPPPAGKTGFPWNQEVPPQHYQAAHYPKISIITPSFNQGHFIEQTIRSVLLQNYPNLEYIVIDGGSTDGTLEILKKYEQHITYWVSEKDEGQSHAINKGIARATGEAFNWLNSDDYYMPDALRRVGEAFADAQTQVVCMQSNYVDESGKVLYPNPATPHDKDWLTSISRMSINQPATFMRLERVKALGGVQQALHYSMDWDLWFRYQLVYKTAGIVRDEFTALAFRLHGDSKTTQEADSALQSKFEDNMWQVLRGGALAAGDTDLVKGLDALGFTPNADYHFLLPESPKVSKADIRRAVHNHLCDKVNKAYYRNAFRRANAWAQLIDRSVLTEQNRKDLRYLTLRIFFKKWFSKE